MLLADFINNYGACSEFAAIRTCSISLGDSSVPSYSYLLPFPTPISALLLIFSGFGFCSAHSIYRFPLLFPVPLNKSPPTWMYLVVSFRITMWTLSLIIQSNILSKTSFLLHLFPHHRSHCWGMTAQEKIRTVKNSRSVSLPPQYHHHFVMVKKQIYPSTSRCSERGYSKTSLSIPPSPTKRHTFSPFLHYNKCMYVFLAPLHHILS